MIKLGYSSTVKTVVTSTMTIVVSMAHKIQCDFATEKTLKFVCSTPKLCDLYMHCVTSTQYFSCQWQKFVCSCFLIARTKLHMHVLLFFYTHRKW